MLNRMSWRGHDQREVMRAEDAVLAVSRFEWESNPDFGGPVSLARHGDVAVAADASIYHRRDLLQGLSSRGVEPAGQSSAQLVLAAYQAWGDDGVGRLEGDFSFVLWDGGGKRALVARDIVGWRSLYFAQLGATLVVGSSESSVLAHPDCSQDLDRTTVGAEAAGLFWCLGENTCYQAVKAVPAASVLTHEGGRTRGPTPYWEPTVVEADRKMPCDQAAETLRHLIEQATHTRLSREGPTSVWMSGGFDSTAVFGAACASLRSRSDREAVIPVSISYPEGDPGREDHLIRAVAKRWDARVEWLSSEDIPLVEGLARRAAGNADRPPAHLFELWNQSLAVGSRAVDARIALTGTGGDQLFRNSDVVLADLLRGGRWWSLGRNLWAKRKLGIRHGVRFAVFPSGPASIVNRLDGSRELGTGAHYLASPIPAWMHGGFLESSGVLDRSEAAVARSPGESYADAETRIFATAPLNGWSGGYMAGSLLGCGVELRAPLFDRRVVEFALSRPASDRNSGRDSKRLLRAAMHGVLPGEVLAPRARRTGTTERFVRRRMEKEYPLLLSELRSSSLRLADLGIVDEGKLHSELDILDRRPLSTWASLFHVMRTEFWLRGRELGETTMVSDPRGMRHDAGVRDVNAAATGAAA